MLRVLPFLLLSSPAGAFTLGGEILDQSGAGAFVKMTPAPGIMIGADTLQNDNLYALDEDQNITLPHDIRVDIGPEDGVLKKGEVVASHYVFFDPGPLTWQLGYVEFDAPIIGVATGTDTLKATDFLANTGVTYLNPGFRGLEGDDFVWIDPDNPFRINVRWLAISPGDYIRVFTARSPGV